MGIKNENWLKIRATWEGYTHANENDYQPLLLHKNENDYQALLLCCELLQLSHPGVIESKIDCDRIDSVKRSPFSQMSTAELFNQANNSLYKESQERQKRIHARIQRIKQLTKRLEEVNN